MLEQQRMLATDTPDSSFLVENLSKWLPRIKGEGFNAYGNKRSSVSRQKIDSVASRTEAINKRLTELKAILENSESERLVLTEELTKLRQEENKHNQQIQKKL